MTPLAEVFEELKPEWVAPVVAWLCHEDCHDTSGLYVTGGGWVSKCEYCSVCNFPILDTVMLFRSSWLHIHLCFKHKSGCIGFPPDIKKCPFDWLQAMLGSQSMNMLIHYHTRHSATSSGNITSQCIPLYFIQYITYHWLVWWFHTKHVEHCHGITSNFSCTWPIIIPAWPPPWQSGGKALLEWCAVRVECQPWLLSQCETTGTRFVISQTLNTLSPMQRPLETLWGSVLTSLFVYAVWVKHS